MSFLNRSRRGAGARSGSPLRARLRVEALEARVVPYSVTGGVWPAAQVVTISFVPDGTILGTSGGGYIYSNLFATLNSLYSTGTWQWAMLLSAQRYAEQTNLNFAVVPDNGTPIGQGSYQQGDPGMGDIRIGGYNFGSSVLGQAYLPPPRNNYSIAGDIQLNTGQPWGLGGAPGTYDLFTVIQHEIGHALGLGHSSTYYAQMYGTYTGIKWVFDPDDIAGIRALYSATLPRFPDPWDTVGHNDTLATAGDFTGFINLSTLTFMGVGNLDLGTSTDVDVYKFYAPIGSTGTLRVALQSRGLSLLAPTLTLYNGSQTQIATISGAYQYGTTLNLTVTGMSAGHAVYVRVAGADTSSLGMGAYALSLNWGSGPMPWVPLPNTLRANGSPLVTGGASPQHGDADDHDEGGLHTFGASPDHHGTAPAPVASAGGPTSLEAAEQLAGVVLANAERKTLIVVAPAASAVPVARVPVAALPNALRPVVAQPETLHSGSGDPANTDLTVERAPEIPSADPSTGAEIPQKAAPSPEAIQPQPTTAAFWRRASETCFATSDQTVRLPDSSDPRDQAVVDDSARMLETAALVAGLTALGSGAWSVHPEEPERHRPRRL